MIKIAVAALVAVVLGFVILGRGGDKAAAAKSCLLKSGASLAESRVLESYFSPAVLPEGQTMPEPFMNFVRDLEKHMWEAYFAGATALLIFTKGERDAEKLQLDSIELGLPYSTKSPERFGSVVVYWPVGPTPAASAAVTDCLD